MSWTEQMLTSERDAKRIVTTVPKRNLPDHDDHSPEAVESRAHTWRVVAEHAYAQAYLANEALKKLKEQNR